MKSAKTTWIVIAACLTVLGIVIFCCAMNYYNWNFNNLSTVKYQTNTYDIQDNFNNIKIEVDTMDISFARSNDNSCKVVCTEQDKIRYTIGVEQDTLVVKTTDNRKWYERIGIYQIGTPTLTVFLPKTEYSALSIKDNTGDIKILGNPLFKDITILDTTGDVDIQNSFADNINISLSTGDVELENVILSDTLHIECTTGSVELDRCDADQIFVKTSTGDIEGSLLSQKVFAVKTSTGEIDVPKTVMGGKCELTTSTGDIEIDIKY